MEWDMTLTNICNYLREIGIFEEGEIIGIGTGRTIKRVLSCIETKNLNKKTIVSSSIETTLFLKSIGIKTVNPVSIDEIDVYVDSADYATRSLELIKGGGGALFTEKLLASISKKVVIIIDHDKLVDDILKKPIPIEVLPIAISIVKKKLRDQGLKAVERDPQKGKRLPVISDVGGAILDLDASEWTKTPLELEIMLKKTTGIVETGLFIDLVDLLIVGYPNTVVTYSKGNG